MRRVRQGQRPEGDERSGGKQDPGPARRAVSQGQAHSGVFGRGHLLPGALGILRFCSTVGVSVFRLLTAATAGQGLQHELGVRHAAVCGVQTGRRGWR